MAVLKKKKLERENLEKHFGWYSAVTIIWRDSCDKLNLKKIQTKQIQCNTVFLKLNYFSAYDPFYYVQTEIKMWKSLDLVLYKLVRAQLAQMASWTEHL